MLLDNASGPGEDEYTWDELSVIGLAMTLLAGTIHPDDLSGDAND
jgi:hypothetical protein